MKTRKSWREKLEGKSDLPKVVKIMGRMSKKWGTGTCVIPSPKEVDAIMCRVPRGKLITINQIRAILAKRHKATIGCPITTGIFAWVAAHAAEEAAAEGVKRITPYWRTLRADGELNPKYPGGLSNVKRRLRAEGHRMMMRGKRCFVVDFQKSCVQVRMVGRPK